MKKAFIILLLILQGLASKAQTWDEWFKQKKTDLKYLRNQIAALQAQLAFVKAGYKIVNDGLTTVHAIRDGEFNIHNGFFLSLKAASPVVKHYLKVAEIIAWREGIVKDIRRTQLIPGLTTAEKRWLAHVGESMANDCGKIIVALLDIVSDGEYEMNDSERLGIIDGLWSEMKERRAFTQTLAWQVQWLSVQRLTETNEAGSLKKLY